jgi:hypothetical protein
VPELWTLGIIMRPIIFKCPPWLFGLLILGAVAPLGVIPLVPVLGWPQIVQWILVGVTALLVVYSLTLLPTKLVLSDEGLWQKLLVSDFRLRWEDMAEWQYIIGPEGNYLWIKDQVGRKHRPKRWLVFGRRIAEVVEILQEKGINGKIVKLKR